MQLDAIDWRILAALQHNGRLSNQDLADRVALSLQALQIAGLVANQDLHPATQSLLLSISKTLADHSEDVFTRGRGFPAFVDRQLPRSPVASRYYERGAPLLSGRLPYWAVSLIDSLWVSVVAMLAMRILSSGVRRTAGRSRSLLKGRVPDGRLAAGISAFAVTKLA